MFCTFYHNKNNRKKDISTLTTSSPHCIRGSSQCSQSRKINKSYEDWQRRSKAVFIINMIVYIEHSVKSRKELLELMNEFSLVEEYKINMQKSIVLYV